jgi:hypothetical protein
VAVNFINNTTEYYEVPTGATVAAAGVVASGNLTWSGGTNASLPASGSAAMVITVCTASGQTGCDASSNTPLATSPSTGFTGFAGPNPIFPYIKISTGTTQIPSGATLTTPSITVNLTAAGSSGTVMNWSQFEFKTNANITLVGNAFNVLVDGWPSAAAYSGPAVTTLPLPAALQYGAPPVLTSTTISGAPTAPGAPTNVTATAGDAQATVTWTAPSNNGGSPITGYVITPSSGSPVTVGNVTTDTVTGLTNGTSYTFTVAAINAVNTGPPSAPSNSVTPATINPVPNNPVTLNFASFVAGMWSIIQTGANWGAAAASSGGHVVRPHDAGSVSVPYGSNFNFVSAPSTQQIPTTESGVIVNYITATSEIYPLPDGTTFVSATAADPGTYSGGPSSNPSGSFPLQVTYCTAPSDACTATTTATDTFKGATTGPYIEIGLGSAQIPAGATLNLPSVTITLTGTSTETVNWTQSEFQTSANISLGGQSATIPVKGYPTAATSVASSGPAPDLLDPPPTLASVTVTPSAHPSVPGAPTEKSATAGNANATITWVPPASNGGSAITGYVITPSTGSPVTVGTVTTYTVTGLTNGTPYTFTVAAINAAGTGPPSNTLPAVTPLAPTTKSAVAVPATLSSHLANTGADLEKGVILAFALILAGALLLRARRWSHRRGRSIT